MKTNVLFLILGLSLSLISCSEEKRWIKKDFPEILWNEDITTEICRERNHLQSECEKILADTLAVIRDRYEGVRAQLNAYNAFGLSPIMNAAGITESRLKTILEQTIQTVLEPIENRCNAVFESMDGLRDLRDSELSKQELNYQQLAQAIVYNESSVDSVAHCLMNKVLLSVGKPEIKSIKEKENIWIVTFKNNDVQYVSFSKTFSGELIPEYSPYITEEGKLIPIDHAHMY